MPLDRSTTIRGDQEFELNIAIPGRILPESQWSEVAKPRELPDGSITASQLIGSSSPAPLIIDLGCGNGRFSLLSSLSRPTLPHVALEIESMHLRYLRRRARQRGVANLHLWLGDAADLLHRLASGSAAEIHIYHPQPWHEAGHGHRRLFQPGFQLDAHRVLIGGGSLCTQTDSEPYALYLRRTLPALFEVRELSEADEWPDGLGKPRGRRELVAAAKGLQVWRFACGRREMSDEEAVQRAARLPAPQFSSNRKATFHRKKRLRGGGDSRG